MLGLARLQRHGHRPIALVGGGTGLVGDPSGKSQERNLLTLEQTAENAAGIRRQLERFLDFSPGLSNAAVVRNNVDWLRPIGFLDFLRDVGKHFTVNYMMAKESVKRRIDGTDGISFTEFSYQLLQAYDFLVLHDRDGCMLQLGGTDQWGNITAGCDLVRKVRGARVHGLVLAAADHGDAAPSSARPRAARCGSIRPVPRRSGSTSSGSRSTTAMSSSTCAGSRS